MPEVYKDVLPNGLRVVAWPMSGIESLSIIVLVRAGLRYENRETNGLSHFLEHMFFRGGERYRTEFRVSEAIDRVGGANNAFTSTEQVGYTSSLPSEAIETGFDVLSDMLMHPQFRQRDINQERGAVLQEIARNKDNPDAPVREIFERHWWGDQPLGWTTLGPEENIQRFSRQDLVAFHQANYIASETVLAVAGSLDPQEVFALAHEYFAGTSQGIGPLLVPATLNSAAVSPSIFSQRNTAQCRLVLGVNAPPARNAKSPAVQVLATILGQGMSSRLFREVRSKRGLAYGVGAGYTRSFDHGRFSCLAGVERGKILEAVRVCAQELVKTSYGGISKNEIEKAKSYTKGSLARGCESSYEMAHMIAAGELHFDSIRTPKELGEEISAVNRTDVQDIAKELFASRNFVLAVTGPDVLSEDDLNEALLSAT